MAKQNERPQSLMTDEQYAEVERRAKDFEAGKTKMLSWEEVKKRIRNKKRRNSK